MNSYTETLKYLYSLQHRGMKFGLRNIRTLLHSVGNPEKQFPSLHIAGTNGKGSTAAFLASIAIEAGFTTALYTSPHLIRFTERIRINGREMSEKRLVSYVRELRPAIEDVRATFFEATTCVAFQYFADEGVDVAIIEAGLGGRLDATNVVLPMASVITNIGLEHTDILGTTIRAIAEEKGGIIKQGVPCITSSDDLHALAVLQRIARGRDTTVSHAEQMVECSAGREKPPLVSFRSASFAASRIRLGLAGVHQVWNARLAIATIEAVKSLAQHTWFTGRIKNATVRRGLERVGKNTRLRGRYEKYGRSRRYILDVAHNPPGVRSLVRSLRSEGHKDLTVVFGVMGDKDYAAMVDELVPISSRIIAVAPRITRSLGAGTLYKYLCRQKIPARLGGTVAGGVKKAGKLAEHILVTGSHYVVGEALEFLDSKKA